MEIYKQIKGNTYEEFVLDYLLNEYDYVYYFKNTPEYIIAKTKLYSNYDIYNKYKNCDIGADLVAVKNEQIYFIQCKNFSQTISVNDFCSFYFLILEYQLNGIVYYNGILSERLTDLAQGKIKYHNLPYNNTIIDINFNSHTLIEINPRDYQLDIYNEFKNIDRGIIALPCGMGKTFCSWLIGKDFNNIIIISPTRNLSDTNLVQLYNYSKNTYNPILISMDGSRNYKNIKSLLKEKNLISSTYDSVDILNKILKKIDNCVVFIDEFHNLSKSNLENNEDQINKLLNKNNKIIFMSATPNKNNKYSNIFGNYIYTYGWKKAIENKYICDFKIILPENTSDTKIFDDFLKNIKYDLANKDLILKSYFILKGIGYYGNKKTIIYASNINEAKEYSEIIDWMKKMLNIEIHTNIIDYSTSKLNRIEYLKQFKKNNQNQILINVQILNEGIDIPSCDSVFITKPNENIINLIQRMCRCNRIMPNKKIAYMYIWSNSNDKIFKYLNKFIDTNYIVEYVIIKKENNFDYNIIKKNMKDSVFIDLLKKHANIDNNFIDDFCLLYDYETSEIDFIINIDIVAKWLGSKKGTIKETLVNTYNLNIDYKISKEKPNSKISKSNKEIILLTPYCFKRLCLLSKTKKGEEVRTYFISLEKLINNYKNYTIEDLKSTVIV